jgi:hypothetical protein
MFFLVDEASILALVVEFTISLLEFEPSGD